MSVNPNRLALVVLLCVVSMCVFVLLMFVPDGSGTYKVRHEGMVTFHFGGSYTIDNVRITVEDNKLISVPFLLWKTGELQLQVTMRGPATYSTTISLGVIHDPIFDTSLSWSCAFTSVYPGTYSITYTLTENGAVRATRIIQQTIQGGSSQ